MEVRDTSDAGSLYAQWESYENPVFADPTLPAVIVAQLSLPARDGADVRSLGRLLEVSAGR